jgi:TRAP-type C4-dicarboxylate transport system permease small subunit
VILAEILVIGFFVIMAWAGWSILRVLEGETLVSLTWMPVQLTQSIIPIGAVLFIVAELVSIPTYWAEVRAGVSTEHPPMAHNPS